ncbi:MAG: hypothetical protein II699_05930 [Lachnospiraceae bacterium]|jgi:hypothetical protein|nr:hypothetical protein [Lachnospiraceae bacterium]
MGNNKSNDNKDYKKLFNQFLEYENKVHEKNQRKIKTGLKVNLILPQCFLILCFMTKSSKLFFLILWIVSLFGIAFYLIYIEYKDYQIQELISGSNLGEGFNPLIGAPAEHIENVVNNRMDMIDDRIDNAKQAAHSILNRSSNDDDGEEESEDA